MKVQAIVRRKTQDLVQDAAEDLLKREVPGLVRVARAELWEFDVDGQDAQRDVREILEGTTLVVNPNVHRYALEAENEPPERGERVFVRVRDRVDPRSRQVSRAVRERLGLKSVRSVGRSVLWQLDLEDGDPERAVEAGRALLANRHAQDVTVEVVRP